MHDHGGHTHGTSERRLGLAALLTGGFMVAEVAGGLISGSLALLADAGHMLTDFAALSLAWFGFRLTRRPADWKRTYGFDRFSILVAFVNGLALFVVAGWIVFEAWHRLRQPVEVLGGIMLWVAIAGLAINLLAFAILHGADRNNLNMRAASLHVLGDLLGSVAAIAAGLIIVFTGWTPIDPILSVFVAVIILRSAWMVVRDSGHILLEGAPRGMDAREIADDLRDTFPALADVHHVHIWSITQERPMITLHARLNDARPPAGLASEMRDRLADRFGIGHATIEFEPAQTGEDGPPQACDTPSSA